MYCYIVTITSVAHGEVKIKTWAGSRDGAIANVLAAERCSASCISSVETIPAPAHDEHVRAYYDQPIEGHGRFEGERRALAQAYELSLGGFAHDDFGGVNEYGAFYARVVFNDCPYIVCFVEDANGFVSEITCDEFEGAFQDYVEWAEQQEAEDNSGWF